MTKNFARLGSIAFVAIAAFSAHVSAQVDGSLGDAAGTGGGTASGGSGGTGGSISKSNLGKACTSDTQCGGDLVCITQAGGAVLPGGLCSKPCGNEVSPDAFCNARSPGSICINLAAGTSEAYCVQSCTVGNDLSCFAREDAACTELTDGSHACIPICNDDTQCTSFTHPFCSGESSWCETAADPGRLPLGARCNPNAVVDECADGTCYVYDAVGNGFCSSSCRIGTVPQCGWNGTSTTAEGLCLLVVDSAASSADLGFCSQLCNCDADCLGPGFVCNPLTALSQLGKAGYCFLFTSADGGTDPGIPTCPGAGGTGVPDGSLGSGAVGGAGAVGGSAGSGGTAGTSRDAGAEASTSVGGSREGSGCGCRTAGGAANRPSAWLVLLIGLLAYRRRRPAG